MVSNNEFLDVELKKTDDKLIDVLEALEEDKKPQEARGIWVPSAL
jgi:hypothetical protein